MAARTTAAVALRAVVTEVAGTTMVRLPKDASGALPSRGQVAVTATLDGVPFTTVVEPDGLRGHWVRLDARLLGKAAASVGDTVELTLEVADEWPEPTVPADLAQALGGAPDEVQDVWQDITPMARWEWVRWVDATANADTRRRRVEVSIDKMLHGKRRPCCFDLSSCTDPSVSKGGRLIGG